MEIDSGLIAKIKNNIRIKHTALDEDTLHLVSSYMYSGCYALIREWLLHSINKTPREIAHLLVDIVSKDYL